MNNNTEQHAMPILRIIQTTAAQWSVQHDLHPLLRPLDPISAATQRRSNGHVRSHCPTPGRTLTGSSAASHQGHGRHSPKVSA
jgi:hypothetical protein